MKVSEAVIEYMRVQLIPNIAGESEFVEAILNGILRTAKKKMDVPTDFLKGLGLVDGSGNANMESFKEFFDGVFEGREKVGVTFAELVSYALGVESSSPFLQGTISFTRADADEFLTLLKK